MPHPRRRSRALSALLAAALAAGALAACNRPTSIAEIRQRGDELRDHRVTVAGEVVDRLDLPLLRNHYYHLDDGTGRIWVQTAQKPPAQGEHLVVTGRLTPGLHVPGI